MVFEPSWSKAFYLASGGLNFRPLVSLGVWRLQESFLGSCCPGYPLYTSPVSLWPASWWTLLLQYLGAIDEISLELTWKVSRVARGCKNTKRTGCLVWQPCGKLYSTPRSTLLLLLSWVGTGGTNGPMVANALSPCLTAGQEADWRYEGRVSIVPLVPSPDNSNGRVDVRAEYSLPTCG